MYKFCQINFLYISTQNIVIVYIFLHYLLSLYFQKGIPCLIMLDKNNSVITKEGRMEVNEDPDGEVRKP